MVDEDSQTIILEPLQVQPAAVRFQKARAKAPVRRPINHLDHNKWFGDINDGEELFAE